MKLKFHSLLLSIASFIIFLSGCKKEDLQQQTPYLASKQIYKGQPENFSGDVATNWFDLELVLIKTTPGFTPPVASRALGYTGVTLYESIVGGMKNYNSLKTVNGYSYTLPSLNADVNYYWPAVANAALKKIISELFPTTNAANKTAINNLFQNFRQQFSTQINNGDLTASEAYGESVATIIYNWSKTDGGHEGFLNNTPAYTPPSFAGAWIPTAPAYGAALQPYWGNNRPFISNSVSANCLPPAPPHQFSTSTQSSFYQEAMEVYTVSQNLTQEQKNIALFWADGVNTITPPGHNVNIATQMLKNSNEDLFQAAIVYAKMGMAVADAFIACWRGKYAFNLMRPLSYIRQNIDPSWTSLIATPPFPTYCSGHATVSGASSEVLTEMFGNKKFIDNTHAGVYAPRSFKHFYEAAEEASVSRLYGGIHFKMDNEIGMEKGKLIGKHIAKLKLKN